MTINSYMSQSQAGVNTWFEANSKQWFIKQAICIEFIIKYVCLSIWGIAIADKGECPNTCPFEIVSGFD